MRNVYLLWHTHRLGDGDNEKLIGLNESLAAAKAAQLRIADKPGFALTLQGFEISEYEINKDHWTEGFVTV